MEMFSLKDNVKTTQLEKKLFKENFSGQRKMETNGKILTAHTVNWTISMTDRPMRNQPQNVSVHVTYPTFARIHSGSSLIRVRVTSSV